MISVVLSGGSGTRLWPVSRASYPKQFCDFYDRSFLKNTLDRVRSLGDASSDAYFLTVKSMEALTTRTANQEGLPLDHVIFEPMTKNTAPAVALLCHILQMRGFGQEIVGLFPSDHLVARQEAFKKAVILAEKVAREGRVVTLGIPPRSADTGYGYIECRGQDLMSEGDLAARPIQAFHEKPDSRTAEKYLKAGTYYWNAGIFVFRVDRMIAHFQRLQPQMWEKISSIRADLSNADYNYALLPSISLDYAVMEKLEDAACIPCEMGWSDVGSWDELARLSEESTDVKTGSLAQVFPVDANGNYVFSIRNKVVGLLDVQDLLVVDTPDALLICRRGESQRVKDLVDQMKESGVTEATEHPFEMRPWGGFEILSDEKDFKSKKITVDPGAQLSYQSHEKRNEHWVVTSGIGEVTLDDVRRTLHPGESVFIPAGAKHRMKNPGSKALTFVEVQTGTYFGEDDIVRYQDDYNRVTENGAS